MHCRQTVVVKKKKKWKKRKKGEALPKRNKAVRRYLRCLICLVSTAPPRRFGFFHAPPLQQMGSGGLPFLQRDGTSEHPYVTERALALHPRIVENQPPGGCHCSALVLAPRVKLEHCQLDGLLCVCVCVQTCPWQRWRGKTENSSCAF